jgi:hypothetical protein
LFPYSLSQWDPWYTSQEQACFETEGGNFLPKEWWKLADDCIAIRESLAPTFVKQFHEGTHSEQIALETTMTQCFMSQISSICERSTFCAKNNPRKGPRAPPQAQSVGGAPFENLIVDFTEMPQGRGCKYLLVFFCNFSGWVKAFPTWTDIAWEVARCLLREIIPQFRIPVSIG